MSENALALLLAVAEQVKNLTLGYSNPDLDKEIRRLGKLVEQEKSDAKG